jgi:hypothetical protein
MTTQPAPYRRHRFPPKIISHAVWLYNLFSLGLRDIALILAERGVVVTHLIQMPGIPRLPSASTPSSGQLSAELAAPVAEFPLGPWHHLWTFPATPSPHACCKLPAGAGESIPDLATGDARPSHTMSPLRHDNSLQTCPATG